MGLTLMERYSFKKICFLIIGAALIFFSIPSPSPSTDEKPITPLIERVEVSGMIDASRVTIEGSKPLDYAVFKLTNPLQVVVDLPEVQMIKLQSSIKVKNGMINAINAKKTGDPAKAGYRVVIELEQPAQYIVDSAGNYLMVDLRKLGTLIAKEFKADSGTEKPLARAESLVEVGVSPWSDLVEVILRGDGWMPDYKSFQLTKPPRLVVDFPQMINASSKKQIIVGRQLLKDIRIGQHPEKMRVVFTFPGEEVPSYQMAKEGQKISLLFGHFDEDWPKKKIAIVAQEMLSKFNTQKESQSGNRAEADRSLITSSQAVMISLNFKYGDVRYIFRLIEEASNLKIILGKDVEGNISLRLMNVPWEQALNIILLHMGLRKIEDGNTLLIKRHQSG